MPATIINDRVLVTDHSHWEVMLKPQELIDGGVTDVILKAGSGLTVDSRFQKNGEAVAKFPDNLRLHAYWWDDPLVSGNAQADFAAATLTKSGLPVLSLWSDMEQWWSSWDKWLAARLGKITWSQVPAFRPATLDSHCKSFVEALTRVWPVTGIYTGRGFITTYAPSMKSWLGSYKIWIAAYGRQPSVATTMTWLDFRDKWLPDYDPIYKDTGIIKENIVGHQFTGDKCLLPGGYQDILGLRRKTMDVSVFQRSFMEQLGEVTSGGLVEETESPSNPPGLTGTPYIFLGAHLWVRNLPNETTARLIDSLTKDQRVNVLEIQGNWARLEKPAGWVRLSWLTKL
jgi:hypothetical protein